MSKLVQIQATTQYDYQHSLATKNNKMFPYQTRCYTKTDKSTTVNVIQRSCASLVNKKRTQEFKNEHAPILFHLFARSPGTRT